MLAEQGAGRESRLSRKWTLSGRGICSVSCDVNSRSALVVSRCISPRFPAAHHIGFRTYAGSTALCCFIYRCGCAPFLSARWAAGLTISTTGVPSLLTIFSCQEICFWCSLECIDFAGAISGERGLRRCSANSESALNRTVWSSDRVHSLLRSP